MTSAGLPMPVCGRVDGQDRLIDADPPLAALQRRAGGASDGLLAVPQLAAVARLARRLGIPVMRGVVAADGDLDLDLWVRAEPEQDAVRLAIHSWSERPSHRPHPASSAEREHDFLRAGADWLWETDAELRITMLSSAAAGAIGESPASMLGQPLTRLFALEEAGDGAFPILAALAAQTRFELQPAELRGGDRRRLRLSGVPLHDGQGRFGGFRGLAVADQPDDAVASRVEEEPDRADAFGARLDHALRSPLDRIVSMAQRISDRSDGPLRGKYQVYAGDIADAGRHLLALVDDLVDLQAVERPDFRPQLEPIDLADVARRSAGLLSVRAADRQVRVEVPADNEVLPATGDFRRALQILLNLIGNAVRYSPPGGAVWVRAEREGATAVVIVADQGKGIAQEDQARIFEKFERVDPSEPGGTGLGLYIARRLARAMGGDIVVESAPGQGARFTFSLPAGS
jgi:signal transduction histidine kinase